jgi:hypothetical protein
MGHLDRVFQARGGGGRAGSVRFFVSLCCVLEVEALRLGPFSFPGVLTNMHKQDLYILLAAGFRPLVH